MQIMKISGGKKRNKYMKTSRVYLEVALKEFNFILENVYPRLRPFLKAILLYKGQQF